MATRNYELVLVLLSDKNADEKTRAKDEAEAASAKARCGNRRRKKTGALAVSTTLRKNKISGHYFYYGFKSEGSAIPQINSDLRVNAGVLKAMITVLDQ
jgi:ribosomal protein S6